MGIIPPLVTSSHIREAMRRITNDGFPQSRKSRRYCLVEDGRHFPPKYTIALAHEVATGSFLGSNEFSGGAESERFLLDRNFDVAECDCGGYNHDVYSTPKAHTDRTQQDGSLGSDQKHLSSSDAAVTHPTGQTASTLRVALVFPELVEWGLPPNVPSVSAFAGESVDFVLFPEAYIVSSQKTCINKLKALASDLGAPLLVGATSSEGEEQVLRFHPDGSDPILLYTKHSTADVIAFDESGWNARDALPTFELGGVRAGATICHDCYLGLLQRRLAKSGARLWLNPSYNNVLDKKWSSVLRLRAVENRIFALCTLHDDGGRPTHPFAFSPDGNELYARKAGSADMWPISECKETGVYIVDLNVTSAGEPLDWSSLPRDDNLHPNKNFKKPVRVSLRDGQPAVYTEAGWNSIANDCIQTGHGGVYVGEVRNEDVLDATKCFGVIDRAYQMNCRPVIWNHWDKPLPTEPERLATLMMGRVIECSAPIVISDQTGIRELVELANNYKIPVRRDVELSEAVVDVEHARGLRTAFKMVTKKLHRLDVETALDRYRGLD